MSFFENGPVGVCGILRNGMLATWSLDSLKLARERGTAKHLHGRFEPIMISAEGQRAR